MDGTAHQRGIHPMVLCIVAVCCSHAACKSFLGVGDAVLGTWCKNVYVLLLSTWPQHHTIYECQPLVVAKGSTCFA